MSGAAVALAFVALAACSHSETPTSGAGALPTASGDLGPTLSATSTPGSPNNPLPRAPSPTADVALGHPVQGPPYVWRSQDDNPDGTVNAAGTSGSGCTPPSGETLPDGVWAGLVADWRPDALVLDLVCAYGPATPLHATNFAQCTATSGNASDPGCGLRRDRRRPGGSRRRFVTQVLVGQNGAPDVGLHQRRRRDPGRGAVLPVGTRSTASADRSVRTPSLQARPRRRSARDLRID